MVSPFSHQLIWIYGDTTNCDNCVSLKRDAESFCRAVQLSSCRQGEADMQDARRLNCQIWGFQKKVVPPSDDVNVGL